MLFKWKSPFNGKTSKIVLSLLSILLFFSILRIWFYHVQVTKLNTKITQSFHDQAKSSIQYLYTCFLNSSKTLASFVPSEIKNDIKYAIIIDAGSSGSRVYIYYWSSELEASDSQIVQVSQLVDLHDQPIVMKVSPGLTNYKTPRLAYELGIKPLLVFSRQHIPVDRIKFTPVYVLATAGMRLIPQTTQDEIVSAIKIGVKQDFKFVLGAGHVKVISGVDEGVYAWIAINYILHRLEPHQSNASSIPQTVGSLDMGGGSLQIAYEVPRIEFGAPVDSFRHLNFGPNNQYKLYVTTYLNYGANQVRQAHFSHLTVNTFASLLNYTTLNQSNILDPCLHHSQTEMSIHFGRSINFTGLSNYQLCREVLRSHLNLEKPCPTPPLHCMMNNVYQAPIDFDTMAFYGFSEFWYTMHDVYGTGGVYYRDKFDLSAREYCNLDWGTVLDWRSKDLYPRADMERLQTQCFKSAWLSTVIHDGFGFPHNYQNLQSTETIGGREIQWTMGALLHKLMHKPDTNDDIPYLYIPYHPYHKRFSNDFLLPILFVLLTCSVLFSVWYCLNKVRRKRSGKPYLPMLERRGHSRASSFPVPASPLDSQGGIPRVTSSNSLRTMLFKNSEREPSRFLDVEKMK